VRATERQRPPQRLAVAALAAAVLALGAIAPVRADYKDDYADGLKAAGDGKWAEVEAKMRAALAQEGAPAARVNTYGRNFEAYVPQFFLGIAAYRRGDCEGAVRNLEHGPTRATVADPKAKKTVGDFTALAARGLDECKTKLAAVSKPPPTDVRPTAPTTPDPVPSRPIVEAPRPTTPTPTPTTPTATPTSPPPKPVVVATAPTPKPVAPPKPTTPAAPAAPPALAQAVDGFLRGRYQQVAALDPATLPDKRARFHLLLLRSASRHTLAQLQGDAGASLVAQAEADVRAAKQLEPGRNPDAALFSPRYRAFFAATR